MARAIVTWCDTHMQNGEQVPAATWLVAIQSPAQRKPQGFEVDLCDDCAKVYEDMLTFLSEYARSEGSTALVTPRKGTPEAPGTSAPDPGPISERTCPECGHVTPGVGGLASHVKTEHGLTLAEVRGEARIPCPEEGCERQFGAPQGVAAHVRTVHGRGLTDDERKAARAA